MSTELLVGYFLLHLAAATVVITQRNRSLFVVCVAVSFLTSVALLFCVPGLGVLMIVFWLFAFGYFTRLYNELTFFTNNIDVALNAVRAAITRRQHVIPRMEAYVGGYARHERETFRQTSQARGGAARSLLVLAESYPALRASQTFQTLLAELVDAENQVYARRIAFNETIREYNTRLQRFPNVVVGRAMGFGTRDYQRPEQIV